MLYAGVDEAALPPDRPLHHQVIVREPLGEGNSVFVSVSPGWDAGRAPSGRRAVTISTHTNPNPWYRLRAYDETMYNKRKQTYAQRLLAAADRALPGLREAADLLLPGTPLAFQRFARRNGGWVGGFPQTNLLRGWGPRLAPNLWMVGDSIFPGQSTAAVALGGLRVANAVLASVGIRVPVQETGRDGRRVTESARRLNVTG
jgi:phytoene dehydrogenase-like protein